MKVGIVGYGFVGKALRNALRDNIDCIKIDPKLNTDIAALEKFKPDIVFICLPTPMNNDGSQDIRLVEDTVKKIREFDENLLIVIKSTILPKFVNSILSKSKNLVINPEFLRENFANEDFINSGIIIFGGDKNNCKKLSNFYTDYTNCICKEYVVTDGITASLVKYTINSFSAKSSF